MYWRYLQHRYTNTNFTILCELYMVKSCTKIKNTSHFLVSWAKRQCKSFHSGFFFCWNRTEDIHSEDEALSGESVDPRLRSGQGQGNPKLLPNPSPTAKDGALPLKSLSTCKDWINIQNIKFSSLKIKL